MENNDKEGVKKLGAFRTGWIMALFSAALVAFVILPGLDARGIINFGDELGSCIAFLILIGLSH